MLMPGEEPRRHVGTEMTSDRKADRHAPENRPMCCRPSREDRAWLLGYAAATGRKPGAVLTEALSDYRAAAEQKTSAATGGVDGWTSTSPR